MTNSFYVTLYAVHKFDGRRLVLAVDGLRLENREPQYFASEAEARYAFEGIEADCLIAAGLEIYHTITVYLHRVTGDCEEIIAEKKVTIETVTRISAR
jgi:hypothetical protein